MWFIWSKLVILLVNNQFFPIRKQIFASYSTGRILENCRKILGKYIYKLALQYYKNRMRFFFALSIFSKIYNNTQKKIDTLID